MSSFESDLCLVLYEHALLEAGHHATMNTKVMDQIAHICAHAAMCITDIVYPPQEVQ